MKKMLALFAIIPILAFASGNKSKKYEIIITNLTKGQILTTPIVVLHNKKKELFKIGEEASPGLITLAEEGQTEKFEDELRALDRKQVDNYAIADTNLLPGKSLKIIIKTKKASKLNFTILSMLATTNDTFVAAHSLPLPKRRTKEYELNAFDAGSEFNNESCDTIPGPPCNNPNVRDTSNAEGFITKSLGLRGTGDLDLEKFGFTGPAAKIEIKLIK